MGVHANDSSAAAAVSSEGGVKYRLVEAEEVGASTSAKQQQQQQAPRSTNAKPKGKLNWSQFPLDGELAASKTSEEPSEFRSRSTRGRGRGGRLSNSGGRGAGGARGGRRGLQHDSNGTYYNGVYVPNTDLKLTADWAKGQIEFYFSPTNLVRDMFLRQHMDVDGYVPLAFVGSFQAVFSVHQDYQSLLDAMKTSATLELDEENEKIRLRENWKQWLWPNADGTLGVPRYIKLQEGDEAEASN